MFFYKKLNFTLYTTLLVWAFIQIYSPSLANAEPNPSALANVAAFSGKLTANPYSDESAHHRQHTNSINATPTKINNTIKQQTLLICLVITVPLSGILLALMLWSIMLRHEVREKTKELHQANKMLRMIIDNIPQRVFWKDINLHYIDGNKAYYEDINVSGPIELKGKSDFEIFPEEYARQFRQSDEKALASQDQTVISYDRQPRDGDKILWLRTLKTVLRNEKKEPIGILGTYEDITEKKLAEERMQQIMAELEQKNATLEKLAITDPLTGLYNRRFISQRLIDVATLFAREKAPFSVGVYDLDGLKTVNDNCGHYTGDQLLIEASQIIADCVGPENYSARHGGDEFVVLFVDTKIDEALKMSEEIRRKVQEISLPDCDIFFGISGGVAEYQGGSIGKLMQSADRALYKAKAGGRNVIIGE